jgi:hypothetical protein
MARPNFRNCRYTSNVPASILFKDCTHKFSSEGTSNSQTDKAPSRFQLNGSLLRAKKEIRRLGETKKAAAKNQSGVKKGENSNNSGTAPGRKKSSLQRPKPKLPLGNKTESCKQNERSTKEKKTREPKVTKEKKKEIAKTKVVKAKKISPIRICGIKLRKGPARYKHLYSKARRYGTQTVLETILSLEGKLGMSSSRKPSSTKTASNLSKKPVKAAMKESKTAAAASLPDKQQPVKNVSEKAAPGKMAPKEIEKVAAEALPSKKAPKKQPSKKDPQNAASAEKMEGKSRPKRAQTKIKVAPPTRRNPYVLTRKGNGTRRRRPFKWFPCHDCLACRREEDCGKCGQCLAKMPCIMRQCLTPVRGDHLAPKPILSDDESFSRSSACSDMEMEEAFPPEQFGKITLKEVWDKFWKKGHYKDVDKKPAASEEPTI